MAGLQDWIGSKARSGMDAYRAWRDGGTSALQQLDQAFPQARPVPDRSVAEVAPPRTALSPEQWAAMGALTRGRTALLGLPMAAGLGLGVEAYRERDDGR